jgi:hypothetical protein
MHYSSSSSSSSSRAESPPVKKGRKVEIPASQPYQNTKINSYLHENHNPGEIRKRRGLGRKKVPYKYPETTPQRKREKEPAKKKNRKGRMANQVVVLSTPTQTR